MREREEWEENYTFQEQTSLLYTSGSSHVQLPECKKHNIMLAKVGNLSLISGNLRKSHDI